MRHIGQGLHPKLGIRWIAGQSCSFRQSPHVPSCQRQGCAFFLQNAASPLYHRLLEPPIEFDCAISRLFETSALSMPGCVTPRCGYQRPRLSPGTLAAARGLSAWPRGLQSSSLFRPTIGTRLISHCRLPALELHHAAPQSKQARPSSSIKWPSFRQLSRSVGSSGGDRRSVHIRGQFTNQRSSHLVWNATRPMVYHPALCRTLFPRIRSCRFVDSQISSRISGHDHLPILP